MKNSSASDLTRFVQVLRKEHRRQAGQTDAPTQDMYGDCQV